MKKRMRGRKRLYLWSVNSAGFIKEEEMIGEQMIYECPCCGLYEIEVNQN
jgi:hypothetical protein